MNGEDKHDVIIRIINAGSKKNMPNNDSDKTPGNKFHLLISQFGIYKIISDESGKKWF